MSRVPCEGPVRHTSPFSLRSSSNLGERVFWYNGQVSRTLIVFRTNLHIQKERYPLMHAALYQSINPSSNARNYMHERMLNSIPFLGSFCTQMCANLTVQLRLCSGVKCAIIVALGNILECMGGSYIHTNCSYATQCIERWHSDHQSL